MHLVVAVRHDIELPPVLPPALHPKEEGKLLLLIHNYHIIFRFLEAKRPRGGGGGKTFRYGVVGPIFLG